MSTLAAGTPRDAKAWLVTPALGFIVALFIYPFAYGLVLSFQPMNGGGALANYVQFFTDTAMWPTVLVTLKLAVPATLLNVGVSVPVAFALRRHSPYQKFVTTLLVIPVTLGTVLVADGMLTYFGPNGWFPQALQGLHLYTDEVRLTHNYWGVLLSLIVSGFPFAFLLMLSYISGIQAASGCDAQSAGSRSSAASVCASMSIQHATTMRPSIDTGAPARWACTPIRRNSRSMLQNVTPINWRAPRRAAHSTAAASIGRTDQARLPASAPSSGVAAKRDSSQTWAERGAGCSSASRCGNTSCNR